jgi:glutamyl-tRNA reductase
MRLAQRRGRARSARESDASVLWALTANAGEVDAEQRAAIADRFEAWLAGGGMGIKLVTCHRVELYGFGVPPPAPDVERMDGEKAAAHLLRVASGLESVIVGEDEVLHQVRAALATARSFAVRDRRLHRLFETAIATGRRARSGRTASGGNLAHRAACWLRGEADLSSGFVVVAGAGRMGAALAHALAGAGTEVVVASRDARKAARLAALHQGRGVDLRGGAEMASRAAGVAVALAGPWSELDGFGGAELPPIADISAPQSVPQRLVQRRNVRFLGIDDLYRRPMPPPGAYIEDATRLVEAGLRDLAARMVQP